ncbi:MAG: hypothetical protein AAFQ57_12925, partial [Cyanobacteria bacterium J06626_14]
FSMMRPHYDQLTEKRIKCCEYDMDCVLRYIALAILFDNESIFYDQLITWLQTILRAYNVSQLSTLEYSRLKMIVTNRFTHPQAVLINNYLDFCIQAFSQSA